MLHSRMRALTNTHSLQIQRQAKSRLHFLLCAHEAIQPRLKIIQDNPLLTPLFGAVFQYLFWIQHINISGSFKCNILVLLATS